MNGFAKLKSRCLSIDLEVHPGKDLILKMAAVRGDTDEALTRAISSKLPLNQALKDMEDFGGGMEFLLGHNALAFDLPLLKAKAPHSDFFNKPAIDTLILSPLASPGNPYHHLLKHYKTGELQRLQANNPELDARAAFELCDDHYRALSKRQRPELLSAWHYLSASGEDQVGINIFFSHIRKQPRPDEAQAKAAIKRFLRPPESQPLGCLQQIDAILENPSRQGLGLAYAMAWLSVAGGNSVMPPWVRHQFPSAGLTVRKLRDTPCHNEQCDWCGQQHNARKQLKLWFGFDAFRARPASASGLSIQQKIVEEAMRGEHVLGILPTGAGKSVCYQLPALSRYNKRGALTVVISPLVALMADQIANMEKAGIHCSGAINGNLTLPERSDMLSKVRLGDLGIVIISPEQLRNRGVRLTLEQREIGGWVIDEAHCISKWGHDFRPDYRYLPRVIKNYAGDNPPPPLLCLTATAKPEVMEEITTYFKAQLGIDIRLINGGANRADISYEIVETSRDNKMNDVMGLLQHHLPQHESGGAIVYCSTRQQTEETGKFINEKGREAEYFHAGLTPEKKKNTQERFIKGDCQVITATNAFGMGIDKRDIRLVIHADIPGSMENYLQEAGRAGRDRQGGRCILLFNNADIERQFSLSAYGRLTAWQINAVLRALKRLHRRNNRHQEQKEIIATAGEILQEDENDDFRRDSITDDTKVRTALLCLEEEKFLTREENKTSVFASSLRVSFEEAKDRLLRNKRLQDYRNKNYREQLLEIVKTIMTAAKDEAISTDRLTETGLNAEQVQRALRDLERLGIAVDDTALTAFVHVGVNNASLDRHKATIKMEKALIARMRENAPDLTPGNASVLHLRRASQELKNEGHTTTLPEKLLRLLRSLVKDGRAQSGERGSIDIRKLSAESVRVTLRCSWPELEERMRQRHTIAGKLLNHLVAKAKKRGVDILVETSLGKLNHAVKDDLSLGAELERLEQLRDNAMLWLHEQDIIRLNKGLAIYRQAMTIRLHSLSEKFLKEHFAQLKEHYEKQTVYTHVIAEYARTGLQSLREARQLVNDYFTMRQPEFLRRWLPGREKELRRQTTAQSWKKIVSDLGAPIQQKIVRDDREKTNVLVLAGPGSGKTRVLVHRIAYLVRVRRENPHSILALAYNRHAMLEIRRRLRALIGQDAIGVSALTCHALAMRLVGTSFESQVGDADEKRDAFKDILLQAKNMLNDDADGAQRERMLKSYRWIMVDEYQDINEEQYELISALVGRSLQDQDAQLNLFAVGDDDQNIYEFNDTSTKFIKRFREDYNAKPEYLTENYRSTAHIINASNLVIAPARERMKTERPITINRQREGQAAGGFWHRRDRLAGGRVQILPAGRNMAEQALAVMEELRRLAALDDAWDWKRAAVVARRWEYLDPVLNSCESNNIPAQMANNESLPFHQLRETQMLIERLRGQQEDEVDAETMLAWLDERAERQNAGRDNPWLELLRQCVNEYSLEGGASKIKKDDFIMQIYDWGRRIQPQQKGLLLTTAHSAKGLEFDHVAVLDGGWSGKGENEDTVRRLYYVAMTRARQSLMLARMKPCRNPVLDRLEEHEALLRREEKTDRPYVPEHMRQRLLRLSLSEVDIGYAGRKKPSHPIHRAISGLQVGDKLMMETEWENGAKRWVFKDMQNNLVGRTAAGASDRMMSMAAIKSVRVKAVVRRRREQSGAKYLQSVQSDKWEVVIPEIKYLAASR